MNLTIDMGYRGEFDLIIRFTDQNGQTHEKTFAFKVYGEKPTCLTVATTKTAAAYTDPTVIDEHTLYATTNELMMLDCLPPARTEVDMPINQRIRLEADRIWEIGRLIHAGPFSEGQRLKALATELHGVAMRIEKP